MFIVPARYAMFVFATCGTYKRKEVEDCTEAYSYILNRRSSDPLHSILVHQSIQSPRITFFRHSFFIPSRKDVVKGTSYWNTVALLTATVDLLSVIFILFDFKDLCFVSPKVIIVGSCVLLYVGLTVHSYPQGYGHDEDDHVDYYVSDTLFCDSRI